MNLILRKVLPPKKKFTGSYYSSEQLEKLPSVVANTPIESAVFITSYYGLRRSEVLGLKWNAIDFEEGIIYIKEVRVKYLQDSLLKKPKNNSSERILPLIKNVEEYLKALKEKQKANKKLLGDKYNDSGYVCCLEDGSPIQPNFLSPAFKLIIDRNSLPHIRFHDIRHSTASLLLKMGFSMKEISVWLGHGDISITMNISRYILKNGEYTN